LNLRQAIDRLLYRKADYQNCFLEPNGKPTAAGERVLKDLARFCRANASTAIVSPLSRTVDPLASAIAEGRREVYLRIIRHLYLDETYLTRLEERNE
jgi:S-adenosylmethionine:diacylglycerol 3-amino-3-carboxypropyl transferase